MGWSTAGMELRATYGALPVPWGMTRNMGRRCSKWEAHETWFIPIFPKVSFNIIFRSYCIILIILHYVMLHSIILCSINICHIILYYAKLYCIISCYFILHYIEHFMSYIYIIIIEYNIVWLYHRSCYKNPGNFSCLSGWHPPASCRFIQKNSPFTMGNFYCPNCLSFQLYPSIKHW